MTWVSEYTVAAFILAALVVLRVVVLIATSVSGQLAARWLVSRWRELAEAAVLLGLLVWVVGGVVFDPRGWGVAYLLFSFAAAVVGLAVHLVEVRRARAFRVELPVAYVRPGLAKGASTRAARRG